MKKELQDLPGITLSMMNDYSGKKITIRSIIQCGNDNIYFYIKEDPFNYMWPIEAIDRHCYFIPPQEDELLKFIGVRE